MSALSHSQPRAATHAHAHPMPLVCVSRCRAVSCGKKSAPVWDQFAFAPGRTPYLDATCNMPHATSSIQLATRSCSAHRGAHSDAPHPICNMQHATCDSAAACSMQRPRRTSPEVCRWRTGPCGPGQVDAHSGDSRASTMQPDPRGTDQEHPTCRVSTRSMGAARYFGTESTALRCAALPKRRRENGASPQRRANALASAFIHNTESVSANRRAVTLFAA